MKETREKWRMLGGAGMVLIGAMSVVMADAGETASKTRQPETIILPEPKPASAPATMAAGNAPTTSVASAPATAPSPPPRPVVKKAEVPGPAAVAAAMKLVDEVYREDLQASRTREKKETLARRLQADAQGEKDPAGHYAMLLKARDLAVEAGDVSTVGGLIAELERSYDVDGLKLAAEVLQAVSRMVHTPPQKRALVTFTSGYAERALTAGNYDTAKAMAEKCAMAARMTGEVALIKDAMALSQGVADADAASNLARKAMEVLATNPQDAEANLKLGTYRCFYREQWKEGLPNLAAGSDTALADLARQEMATPATPDAIVKLGDAWWDVGQKGTPITKKSILRHAAAYYTAALPSLSGLVKAKVMKRLEEARESDGLEVPQFVTTFLDSVAKQLPTRGDSPKEFSARTSALMMPAQSCLKVNGKDIPIRFQARLKRVTLAGNTQSMTFEQQFDYNGTPVRLVALRTKQTMNGQMDAEFTEASAQLKDRPDTVYWIEGNAQGFFVTATSPEPGEPISQLMLRVRWALGKTFTATPQ